MSASVLAGTDGVSKRRAFARGTDDACRTCHGVVTPVLVGIQIARATAARSGAGMRAAIDVEQPFGVDRRIDLRSGEGGVAEQLLDRAQVAAAREQMGRKRMA